MIKLKITKKQYDSLILNESENRLKESSNIIINEDTNSSLILNEGFKDVVLSVAMLLGIGLTGQNKLIAQNAVKNSNTMAEVKSTLENEDKIKSLVDAMKNKGMEDPSDVLSKNAEKLIDNYNKIASDNKIKYKVDVKAVNNLLSLNKSLKQGYALKSANIIKSNSTAEHSNNEKIQITDTIDIEFGSDNLFVTGGYTLTQDGIDSIKLSINEIINQGGKIDGIEIESSTDSERSIKFKSETDPTGNIKLADLRTQSVSMLLDSIVKNVSIKHREIPNNGSNIVSIHDFIKSANDKEATSLLREKTKNFRYVKIKINATFEAIDIDPNNTPKPEELINKYRFELVKVIESTGKNRKINTHVHFKNKKFKCTKPKDKLTRFDKCETF